MDPDSPAGASGRAATGVVVAALLYAACRTALTRLVVAAGRTRLRPLLAPAPTPAGAAS